MSKTFFEHVESRRYFAALTGVVFHDLNADNSRQSAEPGLAGGVIYFDLNRDGQRQSSEPKATSGTGGSYTISSSSLVTGRSYTVRLIPPSGYHFAREQSVAITAATTKAPAFGTWKYAKVTIKAYLDANKNYKPDSGEPTLTNVQYWADTNNNVKRDATDPVYGPGTVTLNLKPGFHRFSPLNTPSGHKFITTTVGNFTVTSGQVITGASFGFYHPTKYAGYVYQDKNKNGKYDTGEGIADRRVFADRDGDNHQDLGEPGAISDATGYYALNMDPGTFTIRQVLPIGWSGAVGKKITVAGGGYTTVKGNDLSTAPTTVATHGTISGIIFNDANGNRVHDSGEGNFTRSVSGTRGQPNVFLDLNRDGDLDNDERVAEVDENGKYSFTGVLPGTYAVTPYGYHSTWITTAAKTVTIAAGQTVTATFGARAYTQINVQRFLDGNGNGVADGMDLGNPIPSVIYVDANNNGKLDTGEIRTNDDQGGLHGLQLPAGTYRIRQVVPSGLIESGHGGYNLAATSTFATDYILRLPADDPYNNSEMTLYFANAGQAAVTGSVFEDRNGNGKFDASDWSSTDLFDFAYADANNNRKYDEGEAKGSLNLDGTFKLYPKPGSYTIRLSVWGGIQQTAAINTNVTVAAGVSPPPVMFGVRLWRDSRIPDFNVTGTVFNDKNRNGQIDAGESGSAYAGWRVYFNIDGSGLLNNNNAYASAVIGADGKFTVPIKADGTPFTLLLENKTGLAYSTPSSHVVSSSVGGATLSARNFGLYAK